LVVALQWLALNRGRLAEIARTGTISLASAARRKVKL
jgi:hypothetical protein